MTRLALPFERSYWVYPNRLIAGEIPAASNNKETKKKLQGLINMKVSIIINLMETEEKDKKNQYFFDYSTSVKDSIETIRIPIKDLSVPTTSTMQKILDTIDKYSRQNKIVYVHCWGGVGRTGTVVGCFLKRHGLANNSNVFDKINELKKDTSIAPRNSPETIEQMEFVLNWQEHV